MRRSTCIALLLLLTAPLAHAADRRSANERGRGQQIPPAHIIEAEIDPATGTLKATDVLTLPWQRSVAFQLHADLDVSATCDGQALTLTQGAEPGAYSTRLPPACRGERGLATLTFELSGRIVDPVTDEPSLHFVTGDRTSGIISEEGAFLAGGTGWYPETGDLALFDASVTVPAAWSVVSQGDAHAPEDVAGSRRMFRYSSATPTDGLALSAGPYVVESVDHEGVRISTWLWKEDAAFGPPLIEAAKKEVTRLTRLLGPYPGTKFDIVENFFTTGYGFPSYTLLGRDVIRMGPRALRPGYLDHEIAHVWLGNHVSVDSSKGNWCEGLTTWVTNYLNTAAAGEAEALEARQRVSQRYSIDVPRELDVAPASFVSKSDDVGGSVGYGKVSMFFHLLGRIIGEEALWKGLRDFVATMGGKRAAWSDIQASMEKASGRDLGTLFDQWIARKGLPEFALENVRDEGGSVNGEIVQLGELYTLPIELEVRTIQGQVITETIEIAAARTPFRIALTSHAQRVRLDPSFHVPRRMPLQDLPPSLARTLASRSLLAVHGNPVGDDAPEREIDRENALRSIAQMATREGGRIQAAQDTAEAEMASHSTLLLGTMLENGWVRERASLFDEGAGVDLRNPTSFRAGNRRWRDASASVLVSVNHPVLPGETLTAWVPNWFEALDAGRMLFYYGWDTWVALEGGRARARGTVWPERSATSVVLSELAEPGTPAGRMRVTIDALLDPRFEGRGAGAHAAAAGEVLEQRLQKSGVEPFVTGGTWRHPFFFSVRDIPGTPGLQIPSAEGGRATFLPVVPATEWLPLGAATGESASPGRIPRVLRLPQGVVFAGGPAPRFDGLDLGGSAVIVRDDGSPGVASRIVTWIDEALRRNAEALIVLRPDAAWPGEPGLVIAGSIRDPAKAERLEKLEAEHGRRALHRLATADRARMPGLERHREFPLFFAGTDLADALTREKGLTRGARSFAGRGADLRLSYTLEGIQDFNLLGRIPGRSGAPQPVVIVSAHHDGLGEAADGHFQEGAADNAAGVAVVVEIARRLALDPAHRSVVIALLSGEEWGLQGSRALVNEWTAGRPQVKAVINVDSVGHGDEPLHVIGRSREPALAAVVEDAARAAGLEVGPDIDRHADRDGSDHWPWVAKGVPAINLFQADYGVINTPRDTVDKLDDDSLERMADALEASIRRIAGVE